MGSRAEPRAPELQRRRRPTAEQHQAKAGTTVPRVVAPAPRGSLAAQPWETEAINRACQTDPVSDSLRPQNASSFPSSPLYWH